MSYSSCSVSLLGKLKYFWIGLVTLLASSVSNAAMVENILAFNPKAYSLGNAVTADYVGIDSLQYNPAALVNLKAGFSTEFRLLGAPLVQMVRRVSPTLTPQYPGFNLFYRGITVRCDSAFKPFAGIGIPSSISANPGRDPVSGGLDPSIPSLNYNLPGDTCFGPELVNPNGVFLNDPLDRPSSDMDRIFPIPGAIPLYLPNIGYKPSEDSRIAFAAQIFSNAPLPTMGYDKSGVEVLEKLGLMRFTFTPGMAFQVTDKLSVGGALRVSKSSLQAYVDLEGHSQLFGFLNAVVNDMCTTNQTRRNDNSAFLYDQALNCIELYKTHQERVDAGLARTSGYWPFLPWDNIGDVALEGDTPLIYSWNLGVQWQPMPWITLGATYRSKEDDWYSTKGRVYYSPGVSNLFQGINSIPVLGAITSTFLLDGSTSDAIELDLNVPWPAAFSTGVSMQLLEKTKLNVEYRKYYYSDWKYWDVNITNTEVNAISLLGLLAPNSDTTLHIPAGGEDSSYYAYGIEHQWNKRLAYRAGYEDRPLVNDDRRGIIPLYGIRMISLGAEYKITHDRVVDVALTSMTIDGTPNNNNTLAEDPLDVLTIRGAEYRQEQFEVNLLIFVASYTHRF